MGIEKSSFYRKALIIGATGQDGAYLSRLLLEENYLVVGTCRDPLKRTSSLEKLGISGRVTLKMMAPHDFRSVAKVVNEVKPDEIYYLAGQTSVGLSFDQPVEAIESIALGILNVLEAVKMFCPLTKIFNASSSEVFGDTSTIAATLDSAHRPKSPYAVAKSTAQFLVNNYRDSYGIWACNGILFNHESPLRGNRFVTTKIVSGALSIANKENDFLTLGNLEIHRDWGWAPEYVVAIHKMLQQDSPDDHIIATGRTTSLKYLVNKIFQYFGLSIEKHLLSDPVFLRPSDIVYSSADILPTSKNLGWTAAFDVDDVARMLCESALKQ